MNAIIIHFNSHNLTLSTNVFAIHYAAFQKKLRLKKWKNSKWHPLYAVVEERGIIALTHFP